VHFCRWFVVLGFGSMNVRHGVPHPVHIRETVAGDCDFLKQMLSEAFFWDPGIPRPSFAAFSSDPEFRKLLEGWGSRPGDEGLIAEEEGVAVGAAWFRLWSVEVHSYGFVRSDVPEVAMAVKEGCRSRGVGRALLEGLIQAACAAGYPALSLSVSPKNRALKLYTRLGFRRVGESGTSWTLMLPLGKKGRDD
jgi:ribosomal protein S18 acetylase RimI-like enzyme